MLSNLLSCYYFQTACYFVTFVKPCRAILALDDANGIVEEATEEELMDAAQLVNVLLSLTHVLLLLLNPAGPFWRWRTPTASLRRPLRRN
jgi:hypothetical protein